MRYRTAALAAFLVFAAVTSRAADYVSIAFGGTSPLRTGDFDQAVRRGLGGGLEYVHHWGMIGAGLQLDYQGFRAKTQPLPGGVGSSVNTASAASGEAILRLAPFHRLGLGPYAYGGAGLNRFTLKEKATPPPGYAWADTGTRETRAYSASSTGLAYVFGAGFESLISSSGLTLGAEARWNYYRIDPRKFGARLVRSFEVLGRIGVRF